MLFFKTQLTNNLPFFKAFREDERKHIIKIIIQRTFDKGQEIDFNSIVCFDYLYIILQGQVEAYNYQQDLDGNSVFVIKEN